MSWAIGALFVLGVVAFWDARIQVQFRTNLIIAALEAAALERQEMMDAIAGIEVRVSALDGVAPFTDDQRVGIREGIESQREFRRHRLKWH